MGIRIKWVKFSNVITGNSTIQVKIITLLQMCIFRPWQVIQRRVDRTTDFYRDWKSYKDGFGDFRGNLWLGGSTQFISYANNRSLVNSIYAA